jgi:hypothetical protein
MEWAGDEKRIQALFSELSLENQSRVPQFAELWTHAQAHESAFRRAFAPLREKTLIRPVAILVLVTAACSLAVWTWSMPIETPNIAIQLPPSATLEAPSSVKLQPARTEPRHQKHIARRRQVDRSIATEAALLSNWQSPTQRLMTSPTDLALGSLPVLNQSAKDLESFLSKNSEIMKESNR